MEERPPNAAAASSNFDYAAKIRKLPTEECKLLNFIRRN